MIQYACGVRIRTLQDHADRLERYRTTDGLPHQLADLYGRMAGDLLVCSNAHLDLLLGVSHDD